jgi:cytochrome d ubiquinol oxidase subunit I
MVAFGATLSAVWIVVANSWQQTPAGYHIVGEGLKARAEITDFWGMVFNPSSMERLSHVISGAWLAGAFLVLSVSAYYILKNRHVESSKAAIKIGLTLALFASLLQLFTGHQSAIGVAKNQPAKLAAFEAHFDSLAAGDLHLFGWVNEDKQEVNLGVKIPGMLSYLIYGDASKPVKGLNSFAPEDRPPVNIVFQTYHIMVAIGMLLILISLVSVFLLRGEKLFKTKWMLVVLVFSVLLPQIANQIGWITAEVGRQPWIVYGLLRTSEALSKAVVGGQIVFSLVLFTIIYILLFALFIYLLDHKIKLGPDEEEDIPSEYERQKEVFAKPTKGGA